MLYFGGKSSQFLALGGAKCHGLCVVHNPGLLKTSNSKEYVRIMVE